MVVDPTIYDIATRAGVGIATVSRVLNGASGVAEATRRSVQKAMSDLGFRPNRAARRLAVRGPNRGRVAAIMPFFSTNFYFAVCKPLAQGLSAADMDLVLYDVVNRESKLRLLDRIAAERSYEGILVCSMGIGPERQSQFARLGIPVVCIDYPLSGLPSVTVDNRDGAMMAASAMRDGGSQRLSMITGPPALAFRHREEGFMRIAGSEAPVVRALTVSREAGRAAAAALLDGHPLVDGIVTVNDVLAIGVLEELRARHRRIPEDVQVTGFDDQPLMDVLGLSTVRQPMLALGEWAARAIQSLIQSPHVVVPSAQLSLSFIPRATTRPRVVPESTAVVTSTTTTATASAARARSRAARAKPPARKGLE
jgi:DNA-binding LacI/PurR family transcriptional regulator